MLQSPTNLCANSPNSRMPGRSRRRARSSRGCKRQPKDEVIFETGYGPSGLPHIGTFGEVARTVHGAPRLSRADRRQDQDPPDRLLRRHGRAAQGARQRPQQGDAGAASRQAADQGARSVRHPCKLRRAQQRAAARLPRSVRLRLRIHVVDRLLHVGAFRRRAAQGAGALRRSDGHHAAVAARGACADLFAVPADLSAHRRRAAGAGDRARCEGRHHHLRRSRDGRARDHAGDRRPLQAAMEAGLGDALDRARRRLRNGRQGSDRFGQAVRRNLPRARRHCRRKDSTTSSSSTRTARRSPSRRATASPSRNGCAMPARRACRCSCIASRRRRSGSISTSSRVTSTSISNCSTPISGRTRSSGWPIRSGTSTAARRPRPTIRSPSRCCSRWSPRRTRRTPRRCGASSAATGRA